MIKIIYPETMSKKEVYDMTRSPAIKKMSDAVGDQIEVSALYLREEVNTDGEIHEVCSIMDNNGNVYATNSKTFINSLQQITDIGFPKIIEVVNGTSRNGRKYIDCLCVEFMEE